MSADGDGMIGQTVDGKYRVVERIGRGGMGTVYRATDDTLNRDVAIKVLNAGLQEPEIAKRFRAEAMTVARLNHPGIATVYELLEHEGQWLMVMEFVRGETLEALIERTGPLSPERAAEVCLHALAALAHAHGQGVVHRDLKPANMMIAESGVIKVMDFGIARVSGSDHLTSAGYMMGTPAYMAPEQVLGGDIDARADLYAMGVVFYRLITGKLPFVGETPFAVAQSHVNDAPTPIGVLRADLPPWVDQMASRALAKHPEERFQSAAAFHEALTKCLSDRTQPATYDPSAPTELLVTPPYALPTGRGTIRPVTAAVPVAAGKTAPMAVTLGRTTGGTPRPAAIWAILAPRNRTGLGLAGVVVLLTVIAGLYWRGFRNTPATSTEDTAPAGQIQNPPPATPPAGPRSARSGTSSAAGAPGTAGAARRGVTAAEERMFPSGVRLVVVTGDKASIQDVVLTLGAAKVSVAPKAGGKVQSMTYDSISQATYVEAKSPEFNRKFAAPPDGVNYPGVLGAKRWLVLQNRSTFIVFRLDSAAPEILAAFESNSGLKIVRAGAPK